MEDLLRRFDNTKSYMTEELADKGITTPPTDKEVWGQMRAVAVQNQAEALMDDMDEYVQIYQERIQAIDKILAEI